MDKIAILGGSFNPIHVCHVLAASYVSLVGNFDQVLIIPTYSHPNKNNLCDFYHRIRMCQIGFGHIPNVIIDPIESYLPTPSFTIRTLEELHKRHKAEYRFVIGSDILFNKDLWEDIGKVFELAPPFVLGRINYDSPDIKTEIELPNISSTKVRKLLKDSKYNEELNKIVPYKVLQYIKENKLYNGTN